MNGTNYISIGYDPVQAYTVSNDTTIPSGGTSVQGYWYYWDDQGFISSGWHYPEGPTQFFKSEDEIYEIISNRTPPNMNSEFGQWKKKLDSQPDQGTAEAIEFELLISSSQPVEGGCIVRIV